MANEATTKKGDIVLKLQSQKKIPKVTVCVITYNQEKYIRDCLQGIIDQHTSFVFEVIVGDDCSTDSTRQIILEFAERYPGVIIPVLHKEKVGGNFNYIDCHNRARGQYVAHVDGDDLVLPGKLQSQADYLDENQDCSVVWHRMNVFDDLGSFCVPNLPDLTMFKDGRVYLQDLLEFGSVSFHSSTMYRAKARITRRTDENLLDWYWNVEYLRFGYGKYLETIYGKYRYYNQSISRKGNGQYITQKIYAENLEYYLTILPAYRKYIFVNSLINLIVSAKNFRKSVFIFAGLALKSISFIGVSEFVDCMHRFRLINPKFQK